MAAYRDDDDFLEEEWVPQGGDDDQPDDWDDEGEDQDDLVDCPECGQLIHAESEQCPACGYYIPEEGPAWSPWQARPWWWLVLGALGVAAVIYALSHPS
jgi:hypothetical protein